MRLLSVRTSSSPHVPPTLGLDLEVVRSFKDAAVLVLAAGVCMFVCLSVSVVCTEKGVSKVTTVSKNLQF